MRKLGREIKNLYGPLLPVNIAYMLQASDYQVGKYLKWVWSAQSFANLRHRGDLRRTRSARLFLLILYLTLVSGWIALIWLLWRASDNTPTDYVYGVALLFSLPVILAHLIVIPIFVGKIVRYPYNLYRIKKSARIFADSKALKIVIAGSYGKTSMKEMLTTVLSQTKKVAATRGNKNVPISHARFADNLSGDEDILIIELGEGAPGDINKFARTIRPDIAVITGLAPAHLDKYPSLKAVANDLMALSRYVDSDKLFMNADSRELAGYIKNHQSYGVKGALGWKVSAVKADLHGTSFTMSQKGKRMVIKSHMLGMHQVGPMVFTAALSSQLGANFRQISAGFNDLKPFEHRMSAYQLAGAWFIDDTYNGNIEGMAAGLQLLNSLPAKRKIYVTPGLVDQGPETKKVHLQLGKLIAKAAPDMVVLMKNSVSQFVEAGLSEAKYKGQLIIENDPLKFYSTLDQRFAAGDLVMMQNDWPDNYR